MSFIIDSFFLDTVLATVAAVLAILAFLPITPFTVCTQRGVSEPVRRFQSYLHT